MTFRWLSDKRGQDYNGPERRRPEPNYRLLKWLLTIGFVSGIIYNRYGGDRATLYRLVIDSKSHDISIAEINAKLDYLKNGMDRILNHLDEFHK